MVKRGGLSHNSSIISPSLALLKTSLCDTWADNKKLVDKISVDSGHHSHDKRDVAHAVSLLVGVFLLMLTDL